MKQAESSRVLIDTSSWIEALRIGGNDLIAKRVMKIFTDGYACVNEIILLELWNGAQGDREIKFLKKFQKEIDVFSITSDVWDKSYHIARFTRNIGKTIPSSDILIFATAKYYNVTLDHCDKHFDMLERIDS